MIYVYVYQNMFVHVSRPYFHSNILVSWRWQSRILEELAVNSRRGGGLPVPIYKQLVHLNDWMEKDMIWIICFAPAKTPLGSIDEYIKMILYAGKKIENVEVVGAWVVSVLKTNSP